MTILITLSDGTILEDFKINTKSLFAEPIAYNLVRSALTKELSSIVYYPIVKQIIFQNWKYNASPDSIDSYLEFNFGTIVFSAKGNFPTTECIIEGPVFVDYPWDQFKIYLTKFEITPKNEKAIKYLATKIQNLGLNYT